jgi:hypothetical protein
MLSMHDKFVVYELTTSKSISCSCGIFIFWSDPNKFGSTNTAVKLLTVLIARHPFHPSLYYMLFKFDYINKLVLKRFLLNFTWNFIFDGILFLFF